MTYRTMWGGSGGVDPSASSYYIPLKQIPSGGLKKKPLKSQTGSGQFKKGKKKSTATKKSQSKPKSQGLNIKQIGGGKKTKQIGGGKKTKQVGGGRKKSRKCVNKKRK